jgi:hypothetical protein
MNPLAWIDCAETVKSGTMIKWLNEYYRLSYKHYDMYEAGHCPSYFSAWSELNRERLVSVLDATYLL